MHQHLPASHEGAHIDQYAADTSPDGGCDVIDSFRFDGGRESRALLYRHQLHFLHTDSWGAFRFFALIF